VTDRVRRWLTAWGPMLPLLLAEGVIWVGFGALLPILPIYFTEHGVDLPTLGVVVAAWPAARLLGEPLFGWVADRWSRKAMLIIGLALSAVFAVAPLFIVGPQGKTSELVNYRVRSNHMIVDRLFAAAELRLGDRGSESRVRIVRTDGRLFW